MKDVLIKANGLYKQEKCCHTDEPDCNCSDCWKKKFYGHVDSYDCLKSLCFYTMNYGPAYASEMYYYLKKSKLFERFIEEGKKKIKVKSLGCGMGPDYYGMEFYIKKNNLPLILNYSGLDVQPLWREIQIQTNERKFIEKDLLNGFSLKNVDVVVLNKVFSTLFKNDLSDDFLNILTDRIQNELPEGSILIFIDINNNELGRDVFHRNVKKLFSDYQLYYTGGHKESSWEQIFMHYQIFDVPSDLSIEPLNSGLKSIIFVYKK